MRINPTILKEMKSMENIITTETVQSLGFSKTLLTNYVREGLLRRVSQGLYALPDTLLDDTWLLARRFRHIVFSHDSALYLLGLSERTPFRHSVTIPSSASLPASVAEECQWFYISPALHELGLTEARTSFGHLVPCYNAERTICDLLRSRSRCDEETVISALQHYAAAEAKDLKRLAEYAQKLKVSKDLKKYMEVLL